MAAISVRNLRKRYGDTTAVDDLTFTVGEGEVVALLGPNGAGKTTTVEILEGHRMRDGGDVRVLDFDPATGGRAFRERIGIVLQEAGIEEPFSVREVIDLYRGMYPRRRDTEELIELVGLTAKRDDRVKTLSGGQRRRLDLALGLVGDPDLIFLDEPTTGFDPSARRKAWDLVSALRGLGKTVLLTTHYMDEAQHLADRVVVVADGRIIAEGRPDELGARSQARTKISFRAPVDSAELPQVGDGIEAVGDLIEVMTGTPTRDLHQLTSWALDRGTELTGLQLTRPSLEETYLELVGDGQTPGAHGARGAPGAADRAGPETDR